MKKFRLLLMMSSLLALVCSFTACSTDITERYPKISVEVTAGAVTSNSVAFTVTAEGADEIYYWVVAATEGEVAPDAQLLIEKGTYLDAQTDLPFSQEVVKTGLAATTQYNVYVYAKNFAHHAYATPISATTTEAAVVTPPTVKVEVVEESVTASSFAVAVTTGTAQKGAWSVVPKYTEGVTAAKVLAEGTALTAAELNDEVEVLVENLNPLTEYDFYVAVENDGIQVLSEVVAVKTLEPAIPVVEMYFGEDALMQSIDLNDIIGVPGVFVSLMDGNTGAAANLFMYDLSAYPENPGYMMGGDYPALSGSFDNGQLPEQSCLLADPSYTLFVDMVSGEEYTVVGDMGADKDGNVYGINLLTVMPDADNNMLTFNVPATNSKGELVIIQGQYTGPLGYVVTPATIPMNLDVWGFTDFTLKQEGNIVTLKSTSLNGDFIMVLDTEGYDWVNTGFVAGEGGNMTGGYISYLEGAPETFEFTSGRISFSHVEGNTYNLSVSTRAGDWIMVGASAAYQIEAPEDGYTITVTNPAAAPASVDNKRWQLPASFSEVAIGEASAVCFVDLGVTMPGKLVVAVDAESIYGADAAGVAMAMQGMIYDYTVTATDATSGKIVIAVADHFGDVTNIELPYSNLSAESVTVDFTNMLGNLGITVCECSLFTKEVAIM